jgi:hypothetical protein
VRRSAKFVLLTLLVLGFAFLLRASIPHVPTGSWQAGNPMAEARSGAASVLLSNGSILVTGGDGPAGTLNTAEVMSNAGIFSSTAPMQSPRSRHTATVLKDGRVLITGGITSAGGGATNSAELYDPSADSWTLVSSTMLAARARHTASLMPDGRVLLAGGSNSGGPVSTIEIFDPSSESFSGAGVLGSPVSQHAAATLSDGRVLIAGGSDGVNALSTTYLFDPSSDSIIAGPNLSTPRVSASATSLLDGSLLIAGGNDGSNDLASAEIYDPAANTLSPAQSNLAVPRSGHQALLLPNNNSVLILGGTSGGTDLASAELYLPWTGNFQSTAAMSTPRPDLAASPLSVDGVLMAAGGSNLLNTELYGFATVKTDQADYAPGSIVTITGSGWQPGETVTLTIVESPLIDTHPVMTTVADGNGNIFNNQFSPDVYDLDIRFYLTAVGSQSGSQAQNTFTDANRQINISNFSITSPSGATDNTMNVSQAFNVHIVFNVNGGSWTNVGATLSVPSGWSKTADLSGQSISNTTDRTFDWTVIPSASPTTNGTLSVSVNGTVANPDQCNQCPATSSLTVNSVNPATLTATSMTAANAVGGGTTARTGDSLTLNMVVANGAPPRATALAVAASALTVTASGTASATCGTSGTAAANLAAGANRTYTYTCTVTGGDGTLTFTGSASGTDQNTAGAIGTGNATTNSITVDSTAPSPPSTPDMTAGSDSGTSNTDDITNVKKPTFTGTETENGTTITLMVDGVYSGTAVTAGGSWSITATNNIADGTHNVTTTATDAVGNVSANSGALSITIDTTANSPSTPDLDPTSDSGSSNTDNITNVDKPSFNGTGEKNATVDLFRGGAISLGTTTADASGNWSLTLVTALADGTYSITAKQTDVAGNVSVASAALNITIDTLSPVPPSSPNLAASSDTGISNSDNITNQNNSLLFSGTGEANAAITIFEGATQVGTGNVNNGGNWNNVTAAGPLSDGAHVFTAKAMDVAGNTSTASAPHTVTIDTLRPNVIVNQAAGQADPAAVGPINFAVVFTEPVTNFVTGDVTLSGTAGATTAIVTGSGTIYTVAVSGMTAGGTVIASINQNVDTDTAGNGNFLSTSTDNTVTYNPDNHPPVVTVSFGIPNGTNGWFKYSPVLGTVTADDTTTGNSNVTTISCTDGVNPLPVSSPSGIGTPSASGSLSVSGEGTHNISCTASDSAGNSGATGSTNTATVKIDTVAPAGVTGSADRAVDHNNWYTGTLTVTFHGVDSTSGIASCTTTSYSGPDSMTASVLGHCTDNAGNSSADAPFNFQFDSTPPTAVALSVTAGTVGENGWYTSDVTVHTAGTELVGDPAICTLDQFQITETAGQVFNGSCTNDAGLTTNASALTVKLDKTAPTAVALTPSGTLGLNGWYISHVTIQTSATENISNPIACTSDQTQTTDTRGQLFHGSCTNDAGLSANASDITVKRDATPPVLTLAFTPDAPNGNNGWWVTPSGVPFIWTCTDATSGVDVAYNGGCPNSLSGTVTTNGTTDFDDEVRDQAGNPSVHVMRELRLDNVAPVVASNPAADTCSLPGNASWCRGIQSAGFTSSDVTSGLAYVSQVSFTQSTATNGVAVHIQSGAVTDAAGNTNLGVNAGPYKIDSVAPNITVLSPYLASYVLNAGVAANYSCSDVMSGVASCTGPVASGTNFSTNPVGLHTFTVNSTDVAGNPANPNTTNYSVVYSTAMCLGSPGHAILQPIDLTGGSVFPKKQGSTVPAKFRVCDANGISIGTAGVVMDFKIIQIFNGTAYNSANEDPVSTTPDTMFRWTGDQWMFNISTRPLSAGTTYYYRISLNDGTFIDFDFGLK